MQTFASATIGGHLGGDPEKRYTAKGSPVLRFNVAVAVWIKGGEHEEDREETNWFSVVVFGDRADRFADTLRKGMAVVVTGRLTLRTYERRDRTIGYSLDVIADNVWIADRKDNAGSDGPREHESRAPAGAGARGGSQTRYEDAADLEDLPF